ncbi:glycoside hydrolase family 43 protein [Mucilaginibacter aquariorum]|uniref:Glycoside hydrolase family 43 protein n=1 Tax=Mucilaginibacter aquariorum TaxID=2967225 RepID=A0ABT1SXZ8_9SPHI|nr:glycoside hydrolase family 43 protein [Mucilaginibacter aquariorum]MCQ6957228.1 glycoside hydrolase family 43 protein [Mucilaginibacter aquariorum]
MALFNKKDGVIISLAIVVASMTFNACSPAKDARNITALRHLDTAAGNPIIKNKYTADPAALVYKDKVYLYTGHDVALPEKNFYEMHEWLCYSSQDMVHWTEHPSPLNVKDFKWAKDDAWASQVIERDGKFYWYVAIEHATMPGKAIGVAIADNPMGPFKDARGSALITNNMTTDIKIGWDDIDPSVIIDTDGQAYLFWGNSACYYAKLKPNMTELDGPIIKINGLPNFTEAPWIHKHGDWYYLSYAYQFPEKLAYAMSKNINGPWEFKGLFNELAGNSNTNHQAIIEFKDKSYIIYHNGAIPPNGGSFRRSVCIDYLYYNDDGSIKKVVMTTEGVKEAK